MRRFATYVLAAGAALAADTGLAQSVPEGQSCGGILCDMGVVGHKVDPSPPVTAAPPVKTFEAPVLAPELAAPKKRRVAHGAKRLAKAPVASRAAAPAIVAPAQAPVPAKPVIAAAPPPAAPKAAAPKAAAATPAPKAAAGPAPTEPNPNLMFQPIY